jgi:hypothetical protein
VAAIDRSSPCPITARRVLAWAPPGCDRAGGELPARGVFFGYDFHLVDGQPRLIEINTNAGGGMLNTLSADGARRTAAAERIEQEFVAMFREEWRLSRGDAPLAAYRHRRRESGEAVSGAGVRIVPPALRASRHRRRDRRPGDFTAGWPPVAAGRVVDLIYNRLTDFSLDTAANAALAQVFAAGGVVVTPHPFAHALYADKRNLMLLSDPAGA